MHPAFDTETLEQCHERLDIEAAVKDGRLTPDDAEAWATNHQRLPFHIAGVTDRDFMSEMLWPIPFAVIWMCWRRPEIVERKVALHRYWRAHFWRNAAAIDQTLGFAEAETEMRLALLGGDLNVFANIAWRPDYQARGQIQQVPRSEWKVLAWTPDADSVVVHRESGEPRYIDAFLFRHEVLARWPALTEAPDLAVLNTKPVNSPLKRPPGAKPEKAERIKSLMREMPRAALSAMKNDEMAALFGASKGYCGQLRAQVEAEGNGVQ